MLSWLIERKINEFEREHAYNMDYMREVLKAGVGPTLAFARAAKLGEAPNGLPQATWHAAKLVATQTEDCGPCLQLVATFAERDGEPPERIQAVLEGRFIDLPKDARLGAAFAKAVLANAPEADVLRSELVARFGTRGLVSIAFAILSCRLYPTLKAVLGHAERCSVVRVGGASVLMAQEAH